MPPTSSLSLFLQQIRGGSKSFLQATPNLPLTPHLILGEVHSIFLHYSSVKKKKKRCYI